MAQSNRLKLVHDDPIVEFSVRIPRSMRNQLEQLANEQYAIDVDAYVRSWLSSAISCDKQHAEDRDNHRRAGQSAVRKVTTFRRRPSH